MDKNFLFITIDSVRYDSFVNAHTPNFDKVGQLHKAYAYAPFTYASHAAMFVGFTPSDPHSQIKYANVKKNRIFKMTFRAFENNKPAFVELTGKNIVDGFNNLGYKTIGTAAMNWFNPEENTGKLLGQDFQAYRFTGKFNLNKQIEFVNQELEKQSEKIFVFMNIGETHIPYYYEGADWDKNYNPCTPENGEPSREECERRQKACVEFIDTQLGDLLNKFQDHNILICGDHGDCWGEDGLWGHGFYHEKVLEVPLLFNLKD